MSETNMDHLRLIDELQVRYMDALDGKQMPRWLATFGPEGQYTCTTAESEAAGWKMALILDDCRGRLEDRVKFVDKVWAGTFQDYQTRHFVQRMQVTPGEGSLYQVRSNFSVTFTRSDTGRTDILAAGVYHDVVEIQGAQALFRAKKAVIDAPLLPHYIVYPL
jgi:3-phenylpropionate/cinnamic acid dioxygenase small subunit